MGDLDISLRSVAALLPEDLAAAAFPNARVEVRGWRESQLTAMERRMDDLLELVVDGAPALAHFEWMERWTPDLAARMFEYHAMAMLGQPQQIAVRREEALAQRRPGDRTRLPRERPVAIESTAVVLSGPKAKALPAEARFRTSMRGRRFSGVRFRVIAVHQMSADELLALPGRLWAVFVPAARDATRADVARAIERTERGARTVNELTDLLATMELVAESRGALDAVQEMLMKVMEEKGYVPDSKLGRRFWDKGRTEGRREGLGAVVHQFERKMGRTLTEKEREVLYTRAAERGAEHLGDVVLDHDGPALAAWLAALAA